VFVTGELGLPSMEARYQQLRVTFYGKLICSEEQVPSASVFHATMTHHASSDSGDAVAVPVAATDGWDIVRPPPSAHGLTLWCAQIQHDLYQLGLCDYWNQPSKVSDMGMEEWRTVVKSRVTERERHRWWRHVQQQPILRTYISIRQPNEMILASYVTIPTRGWNDALRVGRLVLTSLRSGTHLLAVHTGRFSGIPLEQRYCVFCDAAGAIEDEQHFLLHCSNYGTERVTLYHTVTQLVLCHGHGAHTVPASTPFDMSRLSIVDQLRIMLGEPSTIIRPASVVFQVLRAVLVAVNVGSWMQRRKMQLQLR